MTSVQLGWCAGIIDGEGMITLDSNSHTVCSYLLKISLRMTHEETVNRFWQLVGVGTVVPEPSKNKKWKDQFRWQLLGPDAVSTIRLLEPHLFTKKPQALLALEYAEKCMNHKAPKPVPEDIRFLRTVILSEMRELNQRGR